MADDIFDDLMKQAGEGTLKPPSSEDDPIFNSLMDDAKRDEDRQRNVSILRQQAGDQEAYGETKMLATSFDVPTDFAARNRERLATFKGFTDTKRMFENNGKLASFFVKDDNADAITREELGALDSLKWFYEPQYEVAKGVAAGVVGVTGSMMVGAAGQSTAMLQGRIDSARARIAMMDAIDAGKDIPVQSIASIDELDTANLYPEMSPDQRAAFRQSQERVLQTAVQADVKTSPLYGAGRAVEAFSKETFMAAKEYEDSWTRGIAEALGSTLPFFAAAALRVPVVGAAAGSFASSGEAIDNAIEGGATKDQLLTAIKLGGLPGLTEQVPFEKIFEAVPLPALGRVTGAVVRVLGQAAEEGGQEAVQQVMQNLIARYVYKPDQDIAAGVAEAAVMGSIVGGGLKAAVETTQFGKDAARAAAAAVNLKTIEDLAKHAAENPLNVRLPDKAKEAIRDLTEENGPRHVYIAPEALSTYFQTVEEQDQFAASVGLTEEFAEARATGRDIEIPMDTYYVNIVGTDIGEALKSFTKFAPDAMDADAAERFNAEWGEAQERLREEFEAGQMEERVAREGTELIFDDVKAKAMDAGMVPDQATQYAALHANIFRVLADTAGKDAGDLYASYGLEIRRALPGDEARRAVDNLDLALEVVRAGKVDGLRKRVDKASGQSLLQRIIARGGIVDDGGNLAAMDLPKGVVRAGEAIKAPTLEGFEGSAPSAAGEFNEFSADDTMRQMWEEGYFPEFQERPTADELYDAIREEAAGTKRFSVLQSKADDPGVANARGLVEFADMLDKAGLDPATMTNDEIRAAMDELANTDPDSGALYQFAGFKAETFDTDAYMKARARLKAAEGLDPFDASEVREDVFRETGYFKGPDGKWRFEISDAEASFVDGALRDGAEGYQIFTGNLEALLKHDKLFAAYPSLRYVPVDVTIKKRDPKSFSSGNTGSFDGEQLTVKAVDEKQARSVLLHEIAHWIQLEEDFAFGGNASMGELYEGARVEFFQKELDGLISEWEEIAGKADAATAADAREVFERRLQELDGSIAATKQGLTRAAAFEYYQRIAGEVEARNVQSRDREQRMIDRNEADWAAILSEAGEEPSTDPKKTLDVPWWTQDIPESKVIVVRVQKAGQSFASLDEDGGRTPEFKNWFGDSKVVDENGDPLVVYHGTAADFDAFDTKADAKHIELPGIFFTADAAKAADFAASASRREFRDEAGYIAGYEGAATVPVYLSIQNPATIALDDRQSGKMTGHVEVREALAAAREAGHDGAIITGWADGSGDVQYVAFDPTQIKSVNNRGTFDAGDPRILYQGAGDGEAFVDDFDLSDDLSDVSLSLNHVKGRTVEIVNIQVGKGKKGGGLGKRAMQELTDAADAAGIRLVLSAAEDADGSDGGLAYDDLVGFYEGFGFEMSGGSSRMVRMPPERELNQTAGQSSNADKRGSIQLAPGRTIINLFDQADMSTFLHESGHFFLEVFRDLATQAEPGMDIGPQSRLIEDWRKLQKYLDIGDDGVISTEAHEKFARTFEAYLMEGKAPSDEVVSIMARFRSWLAFVYKSVKALRVPINDEIRGVMDRMMATDQEIAAAQTGAEFHPAFKDAASAGMSEKQWVDYQEVAGRAVDRAKREMDTRLMQEIARETTAEWKSAKREIRNEVIGQMERRPVYQIIRYLRTGEAADPPPERMFLDRQSLVDMFGEGVLIKLPKGVPPLYRAKGGVHPDVLAELFGFKSGHDMVTQMMSVPAMGRAVAEEVDIRMKQKYGDLMGDAVARARVAQEAIATDATGELLNAELGILMRKGLVTSTVSTKQAKALARDMIRSKTVREAVRVNLYMAANAKAAAEAERAIMKKDWKTAVAAKRRQLLNHYMAMESRQAEKDVEAARKYLDKFNGRKRVNGVNAAHLDQIETLLSRFDLRRSTSLKEEQRRSSLAAFLKEQEDLGEVVSVPDELRDDAFRKSYKQMTPDDLMAVRDAVMNLEHLGRRWARVNADIEAREHRAKVDELEKSAAKAGTDARKMKGQNPDKFDAFIGFTRSADAALLKMEQLFDFLDNGDINGPFRRLIWKPIADAEAKAADMQAEYSAKIMQIIGKLDPRRMQEVITVQGLGRTMTRSDILSVALNTGNASNHDKMMRGEGWNRTPGVLEAVLSHLNADEARAVQEIWDTINELWPQIEALQKKLSGVAPPKIEAQPVTIAGVELAGGYFPMVYDPKRDHRTELRNAASADKMFENIYMKPETWNGFAKERQQAFAAPVDFNLENVAKHIINVIHDTTHREAIQTANKFVTDERVRAAIVEKFGAERYNQLVPWLQSIANDRRSNDGLDWSRRTLRAVRSRASIMAMGLRYSTIVTQTLGYSASLEMVRPRHLAGAMKDFFGADGGAAIGVGAAAGAMAGGVFGAVGGASAGGALYAAARGYSGGSSSMDAMSKQVYALSGEMRNRKNQLDRDIRDNIRRLTGKSGFGPAAVRFGFAGIGYMDQAVTVPTWMAAYRQHLADNPTDQEGAIAFGDQVMRLSQGSGGAKDMAAIVRDKGGLSLLTMFYTYFSAYYARQRKWGRDMKEKVKTGEGSYSQLLARQVFLTVIPAVMADLILGRGPDDDDDEGYALWAAKKIAMYPFAAVPMLKDGINAIGSGFGYSISPAGRTVEEGLVKPILMAQKMLEGDAELREIVKQTITTTGYIMGLPLGQPATSIDNVWKAIEEDDFQLRDLVLTRPKQ